jgi:hypothetical protein
MTTELYRRWLAGWEELGRRIARDPKDPRSTREILLDDRR